MMTMDELEKRCKFTENFAEKATLQVAMQLILLREEIARPHVPIEIHAGVTTAHDAARALDAALAPPPEKEPPVGFKLTNKKRQK